MSGEHIRGIPRTYEKEITLADTPYTLSLGYNCVKVDTTGGNVRVNLPNVNYPIDVIKTSSDSYIVTVWVAGTQKATVSGESSVVTVEDGEVTVDEHWYPYDVIVGIAGVSGDGGEVLAKDRFGRVIARGVAGTDDASVIQAAIDSLSVTGGKVGLQAGSYNLGTSTITVRTNSIHLDFRSAVLYYSGTGKCFDVGGEPGSLSLRLFKCEIGKLIATGSAITSPTAVGIYMRHVSFGAEVSANIEQFHAGIGVQLDSQASPMAYCALINFKRLMLYNCFYGVCFTGSQSVHSCIFENFWWSPSADNSIGIYDNLAAYGRWNRYENVYCESSVSYSNCVGMSLKGYGNIIDTIVIDGYISYSIISATPLSVLNCTTDALAKLDVPTSSHVICDGNVVSFGWTAQYNSPVNLIKNGSFENGIQPSQWLTQLATMVRSSTEHKVGVCSAKITANDDSGVNWGFAYQNIADYTRYAGRTVTFGAWVRASSGNDKTQLLAVYDTLTHYTTSSIIPKDDAWHWITVTHDVGSTPTMLRVAFVVKYTIADVDDVLYVDGAILVEGDNCPSYSPRPISEDGVESFASSGIINHHDVFMDVVAASTIHLLNAEDISAYAGGETPSVLAQPDVPRNVIVTATDAVAETPVLTMSIIISGINARGVSVSETFVTSGSETKIGNVAFATITSQEIDLIAGNGVGDTLSIGIGYKLGLSNVINTASDVYKIKKNNVNADVAVDNVNVSNGTYDMSVITLDNGDDFTIWYKSNLNIVT